MQAEHITVQPSIFIHMLKPPMKSRVPGMSFYPAMGTEAASSEGTCVLSWSGCCTAGGINFDAKLRRESTDILDLFYGHISGMDALARGLRNAARMLEVPPYLQATTCTLSLHLPGAPSCAADLLLVQSTRKSIVCWGLWHRRASCRG